MDGWMRCLYSLLGNGLKQVHKQKAEPQMKRLRPARNKKRNKKPCSFLCHVDTFKTSRSGKTSQPWELKIEMAHLGESAKMWTFAGKATAESSLMEAVKYYFCSKKWWPVHFSSPWSFEQWANSAGVLLGYVQLWLKTLIYSYIVYQARLYCTLFHRCFYSNKFTAHLNNVKCLPVGVGLFLYKTFSSKVFCW